MMTVEDNALLTETGTGTPAGTLLRQYWQPVALSEELPPSRPVKAVRVMGQDFVLFRDEHKQLGLLDRHCPHRGADLAFGRLEDGGLRCLLHGWLFDTQGHCLEMPAEPEGSRFFTHVRQPSYPVLERSGVIFAYLGTGDPPALPDLDCFVAPVTHTFAFKGLWECNWLQALELGMDPSHASFLHRFFQDTKKEDRYGKQFRSASLDSELPITKVLREYYRPQINVDDTPYGLRLTTLRKLSQESTHVRVTNVVFPQAFVIPMATDMTISQWHVPVDDTHSYWYAIFTSFSRPVDKEEMRRQRLQSIELPTYASRKNQRNDYGYSAVEQRDQTFTGMGSDINVHDQWASESMGPIQDRTREHLGTTDKAIIKFRRMLTRAMDAAQRGDAVPMRYSAEEASGITGPAAIDGVARTEKVATYCEETDLQRRRGCDWASQRLANA